MSPNSGRTTTNIAIVGVGPRGLSVLERFLANSRTLHDRGALTIHLVDPFPPGPGRVWRTDQSPVLLMNTVASQVTLFTDHTVEMDGPVETGPSLWEWARELGQLTATETAALGHGSRVLDEAASLTPDDYPSRALYGQYLEDVFQRIVDQAPGHVRVRVHRSTAVALDYASGSLDGLQSLLLANGERIEGLDSVVLCQGHVEVRASGPERDLAEAARRHGVTHVPPGNPADQDLTAIKPGENVFLRGLGLNFFDHMALLTVGRGGRFEREGGQLVYVPSGLEPRMFAASRRGLPHHARGENEKGVHGRHHPRALDVRAIAELRSRAREGEHIRFGEHVWPLIAKEVESTYYAALLALDGRGPESDSLVHDYLAARGPDAERAVLDEYGVAPEARWDWERVERPYGDRVFRDRAEFRRWLTAHLREDLFHASRGNVTDPLKAALDVLRDLRNEVRLAVDHRGLEGNSHRDELQGWYTPLNAFLSIGPPASRVEEMLALMEAGVLEVLGPRPRIVPGRGAFSVTSETVPGEPVLVTAMVEARLPEVELRLTADPLLHHLLDTGQCAAFSIPGEHGTDYLTGGLAVTERPYRLVDREDRVHPRRFAYGIPTESVHWVTAAGVRPGANSVILTDSDAIARAVLGLGGTSSETAPRPEGHPLEQGASHPSTTTKPDRGSRMTPHGAQVAVDGQLDSGILSPVRAGTPVEAVLTDTAWLQAMLDTEAALARSQARLGTLPQSVAEVIGEAASMDLFDLRELALASRETANPVVGLVRELTRVVGERDPEAARYVHQGSTSQDVFDTGAMLVCDRALRLMLTDLERIETALATLAAAHRDTVAVGRTLALHAVPTTFGLRVSGWRGLVLDAADRLRSLVHGGLPVSVGGAAGTLAGYLEHARVSETASAGYADRLVDAMSEETGLARPVLPWHASRTPIADVASALSFTSVVLGKIAVDVQVLARTEIGEVAEGRTEGRGASSAMPHKRNPVLSTLVRSAALQVPSLATVLHQSVMSEDERSAGGWHAEWLPLRECLRLTGGATHTLLELVTGLEVLPERLRSNLDLTAGQVMTERLSVALSPLLGRTRAKRLLHRLSVAADAEGLPIRTLLAREPELSGKLSEREIDDLLDPATYTGASRELVDGALR